MKISYTNYGRNLKDYSIELKLKDYTLGIGLGKIYKLYKGGNVVVTKTWRILGGK